MLTALSITVMGNDCNLYAQFLKVPPNWSIQCPDIVLQPFSLPNFLLCCFVRQVPPVQLGSEDCCSPPSSFRDV